MFKIAGDGEGALSPSFMRASDHDSLWESVSTHFIALLLPFGRIRMSESTSCADLTIPCFFFPNVSVIVVLEREAKFEGLRCKPLSQDNNCWKRFRFDKEEPESCSPKL